MNTIILLILMASLSFPARANTIALADGNSELKYEGKDGRGGDNNDDGVVDDEGNDQNGLGSFGDDWKPSFRGTLNPKGGWENVKDIVHSAETTGELLRNALRGRYGARAQERVEWREDRRLADGAPAPAPVTALGALAPLCKPADRPTPFVAFSPLMTTKSRDHSLRRRGRWVVIACRPDRPTTSPRKRMRMAARGRPCRGARASGKALWFRAKAGAGQGALPPSRWRATPPGYFWTEEAGDGQAKLSVSASVTMASSG